MRHETEEVRRVRLLNQLEEVRSFAHKNGWLELGNTEDCSEYLTPSGLSLYASIRSGNLEVKVIVEELD